MAMASPKAKLVGGSGMRGADGHGVAEGEARAVIGETGGRFDRLGRNVHSRIGAEVSLAEKGAELSRSAPDVEHGRRTRVHAQVTDEQAIARELAWIAHELELARRVRPLPALHAPRFRPVPTQARANAKRAHLGHG